MKALSLIACAFVVACVGCGSETETTSSGNPNGHTPANPTTGSSSGSGANGGTSNGSVSGGDSSGTGGTGTGTGTGSSGDNGSSSGGTGSGSGGTGSNGAPGARVFVTSTTYTGALGGAAGADAHCQTVADAQALGGTWQAWITDGSTSALDRITGTGPWYTVNGYKVFNNKANLSTVPAILLLTESGENPSWYGYSSPWTGATDEGAPAGEDCSGWTSASTNTSGMSGSAEKQQTWGGGAGLMACDTKAALICFEK